MRRFLLMAVLAVGLLQVATTTAAANTITARPGGVITAASLGTITLSSSGGIINPSTQCDVDLAGTLNSTINNAAGGSLGGITSGSATGCTVGSATPLFNSPTTWGLTLSSSADLTNNLVRFTVVGVQFQVTVAGTACLFSGNLPVQLAFTGSGPYSSGLITILTNSIPRTGGSSLCPRSGSLAGTFSLTPQQTLTLS